MCGRYEFVPDKGIWERFDVLQKIELRENYNVAPSQEMPVVVRQSPNSMVIMRWGLIPHWAKDGKIGYKMINARAETIMEKSAYKRPFLNTRCLVPANGFYEWKEVENGKQPFMIHFKDNRLFAFAGIYDSWKDPKSGRDVQSYSIITTSPNKEMEQLHDRMPVILKHEDEDRWLDHDQNPLDLMQYLQPYPDGELDAYPVSKNVNTPKNNNPDVIKRVELESQS